MTTSRLIYAASEQCADLWYLSGFSAPDPFLWFEINGKAAIVVSALEAGRAQKQAAPNVEVISFADAKRRWMKPETPFETATLINAISKAENISQWNVPDDFPLGLAQKLSEFGISLTPQTKFAPGRTVKSPREADYIRDAIRKTECGLQRAMEILGNATIGSDGTLLWNGHVLLAEELGAEINIAIMREGATANGTITAPGPQGADPHCQGYGPIRANQPIVMDVFPRDNKTGYFGDLTRTVVKGTASDAVRKAFETVRESQQLAFSLIKPGVPGKEVHNAIADFFTAQGFVTDMKSTPACGFFHGLGHSIGLEIHESPSLNASNSIPLVPGNVVTVEPGLYYPEWGGIRIEDDVIVTESGCQKLSSAPVFLEIP